MCQYSIHTLFLMVAHWLSNLALHKPTRQSSTPDLTYHSALVVDGRRDSGYALTAVGVICWWEVDLERFYRIQEVAITNPNGSRKLK